MLDGACNFVGICKRLKMDVGCRFEIWEMACVTDVNVDKIELTVLFVSHKTNHVKN